MKEKFKQSAALLTACLPALIYVTWLHAYYWLLEGGRYQAFIQPKLWPLLILALLLLLAFSAAFISQFPGKSKHLLKFDVWVKAAILILPIVFLWNIYGQSLGADAFAKRTLTANQNVLRWDTNLPQTSPQKSAKREISLLDLIVDAEKFNGTQVAIEGLVYRSAEMGTNSFKLFRFAIACCAADALPFAIVVEQAAAEANLKNDTWVRVIGLFNAETINGRQVPRIAADSVQPLPIPPPEKRYLFF